MIQIVLAGTQVITFNNHEGDYKVSILPSGALVVLDREGGLLAAWSDKAWVSYDCGHLQFEGVTSGYRVDLVDCGERKIQCIKLVRELLGIGLKDAKDFAEKTGARAMKVGISEEEARRIQSAFSNEGCTVTVTRVA